MANNAEKLEGEKQ